MIRVIAMNVCLSELRRRKVRRAVSLEAMAEDWAGEPACGRWGVPGREPDAARRVEDNEALTRLGRAMLSLAPDQRAILMLRDLHELDYRQIAETLETPVGTVKSRLFRARVALREAMERLEGGADG
jgi:RNA polymerase sigma-70 factor (ECF subfamily)